MKYETINNLSIPKLGFGTWKIGGNSSPNRSLDSKSLAALTCALEIGYTHFDAAEMYASGHAEELLGQAIRETKAKRETLFFTTRGLPTHLSYKDVLKACEHSLRRLQMDYVDLYLIHWPMVGMKLADTFRALNELVEAGKVKYLGVSNFNLKLLKESQSHSKTPILTNQVPYSLSERSYTKNGVLAYCQKNDILLTAYEPVDKGRLKVNPTLQSIAQAHRATPYQIALAWLMQQPRVITIPMSFDAGHLKDNFDAADIVLNDEEMRELN